MQNSAFIENNSKINIRNYETKKIGSFNLFFLASIVASLNVLFSTNYIVSMIVISFEIIILMYYFIRLNITKYIGSYLVFLCLSFEFDTLVGTSQFYGFKNLRIFGVNLGIVALLPILVLTILKKIKIKQIEKDFPLLLSFIKKVFLLNIIGFFFGLFQILINDNNIQNMDNVVNTFIGVSYSMILLPFLLFIAIIYLISWEKARLYQLESYLIAILVGVVVSMIISLVTENFGRYGGVDTLLVSNVIRYVPFMILFPFYKYKKISKIVNIFAIIGAILTLQFNATGKIILIYIMAPFAICYILWKNKNFIYLILVLFIIPIGIIYAIQLVDIISNKNILFNSKLNQTLGLIKIWDSNWLINMPISPRIRILEFINILYEYLYKPWFLLFGKGYMGTIIDKTGLLFTIINTSSYSNNQIVNGAFYGVHETINILFLYNGLFGLFFYFYMIKFIFKNFTKSPWILIGGFWFLMVYGFSVTMTAFGLVALLLGYIETEQWEILN